MCSCPKVGHPANIRPAPTIDGAALRLQEHDDELPAAIVVVKVSLQRFILFFQFAFRILAEGVAVFQRFVDEVYKERAAANLLEGRGGAKPEYDTVFGDPIQVVSSLGCGLV